VCFVSLATSSAHVDDARFVKVDGGFGDERGERSVLDRGLRIVFEEDEVEVEIDFWTGCGDCRVDDDEGVGFIVDLVEVNERLMAAMAALRLAGNIFGKSCALVFALEVPVVTGFDWTCVAVVLQV